MHPFSLIKLSVFMQVLGIQGKHYTKKWIFFYAYIIFYNLVTIGIEIKSYKLFWAENNYVKFRASYWLWCPYAYKTSMHKHVHIFIEKYFKI
jgi:hypothetical protein